MAGSVYGSCGCSPLKLTQVSQPHAPGAAVYWTTYTYDDLGRTISSVAPDGSTTRYDYWFHVTMVTDPSGKWKQYVNDASGNLTTVRESNPAAPSDPNQDHWTYYSYDVLNHLTQVTMPRAGATQTRTFNYTTGNTVGAFLLSATNPENGTVNYTYNGDGTLATKTDTKGVQLVYSWDYYKRLSQVSLYQWWGNYVLRTYYYDSNPFDSNYSGATLGRVAAIQYPTTTYNLWDGGPPGSSTITEMFSYGGPGLIGGKRLRLTQVRPYPNGTPNTQTGVGDLNIAYSYNNEGKMTSVTYPSDSDGNPGPTYTYSYDSMMRPAGMNDPYNNPVVSNVAYGPANELLQMSYGRGTETRQYNSMLQLTNLAFSYPAQNVAYTFPAGSNNGKIGSQTDNLTGETVSYQYDVLNRLIAATAGGWSQSFGYDGFGNLTARTGTGAAQSTTISTPTDPNTNRLSGYAYDPNGNLLSTGNAYDAENRLVQVNAGGTIYSYDAQNRRIWQGTFNFNSEWSLTSEQLALYGAEGKLIGWYRPFMNGSNTPQTGITFNGGSGGLYFAGKLVQTTDRLGSVGKYYPYGEERNSPPLANDQVKFATYTRDGATGLDYAMNRYYASGSGRFMTPDPYRASGSTTDPQSWNRYAYTRSDPVNRRDPFGLCDQSADTDFSVTVCGDNGGGSTGGDDTSAGGGMQIVNGTGGGGGEVIETQGTSVID